jgi:hypothetical protein
MPTGADRRHPARPRSLGRGRAVLLIAATALFAIVLAISLLLLLTTGGRW